MLFKISQNELIEKTAQELKKTIHMPSWAPFTKTGVHKERPPISDDWWYVRAAAVLRKTYILGPIGVSKLRTLYGGKKNRGVKPGKFYRGSGSVIRKVLQQLEEAKLIKQDLKSKHKGRVITPKGKSLLFSVAKSIKPTIAVKKAAQVVNVKPKEIKPVKEEVKQVPKKEDKKITKEVKTEKENKTAVKETETKEKTQETSAKEEKKETKEIKTNPEGKNN